MSPNQQTGLPTETVLSLYLMMFLYRHYKTKDEPIELNDVYNLIANHFGLTNIQIDFPTKDDKESLFHAQIRFAKNILKESGLVFDGNGGWELSPRGIELFELLREPGR